MKLQKKTLIAWMLLAVLILGACTAQPAEAPVQEPAAPAEEVVEEPVAEPVEEQEPVTEPEVVEPVLAGEAELDAAFQEFLGGMVAYNTIGLEVLNEELAESPPFLLDVRSPEEVEGAGYIDGSVLIPLRDLGENLEMLPAFDQPIVSYCGSGWRCTIALTALEALGWEDVRGLKGGSFGGWVEAGYPYMEGLPPEAEAASLAAPDPGMQALMAQMLAGIPEGWGVITSETLNAQLAENPDLIVIDVRRAEELEKNGTIDAPNLIHIPLEEFVNMKADWLAAKDAPVVVYCGSGHRSTIAMTVLWSYGYTDVSSLKGGFSDWAKSGYPVVGGIQGPDLDAAFSTFLADMEAYNTISVEALNEMMIETPPFLLDVREPAELEENGYIAGAVNVPLRQVLEDVSYLPSFDTTIVSYCGSGWRCTIALTALEGLGYENVLGLKGNSFGGWVEAGYPFEEGLPPAPEALDAIEPDPALLEAMDETLAAVPDGFGVITADALNAQLVENPDLILIDVRRAEELDEKGIIDAPNVIHIPLEDFITMKADWPAEAEDPIVVYCGSGHRSTIAMTILWAYGYTDVHSLKGGFGGWAEAGYPVAAFAGATN